MTTPAMTAIPVPSFAVGEMTAWGLTAFTSSYSWSAASLARRSLSPFDPMATKALEYPF